MNGQRLSVRWRPGRCSPRFRLMVLAVALAMFVGACSGSGDDTEAGLDADTGDDEDSERSSGELKPGGPTDADGDSTADGQNADVGSAAGDPEPGDSEPQGSASDQTDTDGTDGVDPDSEETEPVIRPDGIELIYADGALGPAELGSTIAEITEALGSSYTVTPEESIRVDFSAGYSIARDGEVLFWAIEEDAIITVFMAQNPRVGLESGLRPKLELAEAIARHGEPMLTLGPEGREFASFEDGTGSDGSLSVLVAIGQFGGPVGVYDLSQDVPEATGYELEDANIKELWFWAS